jgi:hypothetical protein
MKIRCNFVSTNNERELFKLQKIKIMTFTKLANGNYKFKGIDTWNGKEIEGNIIYQPYDIEISKAWQVVFGLGTDNTYTAFYGASLKECKKWFQ